jgi:hypothetical protein
MSRISNRQQGQPRTRAEWVTGLAEAARDATDQMLRDHGLVQAPTVHMLVEGMTPPYFGFVTSRPFRRGSDADLAITGLGLLPAVLGATSVVVTWEHADLCAALNLCGDYRFLGAVVVLDVSLVEDPCGGEASGHTVTWYPFDLLPGPASRESALGGRLRWYPSEQHRDAPLPVPIKRLLELWRSPQDHDLAAVVAELGQWGYRIRWAQRA